MLKAERADKNRISVKIPLLDKTTMVRDPHCRELLIPIQARNQCLADDHELDELVRGTLEKKGYSKEQIDKMMELAEEDAEYHRKVNLVKQEIRRRLAGQPGQMRRVGDKWEFRKPQVIVSYPSSTRGPSTPIGG